MGSKTMSSKALAAAMAVAVATCMGPAVGAPEAAVAATAKAPAKVASVKAKASGATKAKVTWKKVKGAKRYAIRVLKGNRVCASATKKASARSATLSGLRPETTYKAQVRAVGKKKAGKWSRVASFTTGEAAGDVSACSLTVGGAAMPSASGGVVDLRPLASNTASAPCEVLNCVGPAKAPSVELRRADGTALPASAYKVSFDDGKDAHGAYDFDDLDSRVIGTAKLTVTGVGAYKGKVTVLIPAVATSLSSSGGSGSGTGGGTVTPSPSKPSASQRSKTVAGVTFTWPASMESITVDGSSQMHRKERIDFDTSSPVKCSDMSYEVSGIQSTSYTDPMDAASCFDDGFWNEAGWVCFAGGERDCAAVLRAKSRSDANLTWCDVSASNSTGSFDVTARYKGAEVGTFHVTVTAPRADLVSQLAELEEIEQSCWTEGMTDEEKLCAFGKAFAEKYTYDERTCFDGAAAALYVARFRLGIEGCYYESTTSRGGDKDTVSRTNVPTGHVYAVIPVGSRELLVNLNGYQFERGGDGFFYYERVKGSWGGNTGVWAGEQRLAFTL